MSITHIHSLLLLLATFTSASPIHTRQVTSAATTHNLYLLTCSPSSGRWGWPDRTVSAVGFFNTPIQNNNKVMDQVAILNSPATSWEGAQNTPVWNDIYFARDIAKGADDLPKGQLAGTATVGRENFACFRDGETTIVVAEGAGWPGPGSNVPRTVGGPWGPPVKRQDGGDTAGALKVRCTADYWCGSVS